MHNSAKTHLTWGPDDWATLAAMVRLDDGQTTSNPDRREYQHHGLTVRCDDDAAAREALAARLEEGPTSERKATRGTNPTRLKPHTTPKQSKRVNWGAVKSALEPNMWHLTNERPQDVVANALTLLDLAGETPLVTQWQGVKPGEQIGAILVNPKPINPLQAKDGSELPAVIGQVWEDHKWQWRVVQPDTGLGIGPPNDTESLTVLGARKTVAKQTDLDRVRPLIDQAREANAAAERLRALREWAGLIN